MLGSLYSKKKKIINPKQPNTTTTSTGNRIKAVVELRGTLLWDGFNPADASGKAPSKQTLRQQPQTLFKLYCGISYSFKQKVGRLGRQHRSKPSI